MQPKYSAGKRSTGGKEKEKEQPGGAKRGKTEGAKYRKQDGNGCGFVCLLLIG